MDERLLYIWYHIKSFKVRRYFLIGHPFAYFIFICKFLNSSENMLQWRDVSLINLNSFSRKDCGNASCQKMKMVIRHYEECKDKRKEYLKELIFQGQKSFEVARKQFVKCKVCVQIFKIVSRHSMYDCIMPHTQKGCPLFMCDSIRKIHYIRTLSKCRVSIKL